MADMTTFNALFDSVIDKIKTGKSHKKYATHVCELLQKSKTGICREYSGINSLVKAKYMKNKTGLLDRHKCAASFMIASIKKLKTTVGGKISMTYLKEKLAILVGLTVLRSFVELDNRNYDNSEIIAFLAKKDGFWLPKPICDNNPYEKNWAIELHHAHEEGKLFALSLANQLFLIESYNRQLAETATDAVP
jgi:hypothetical protein